LPVDEPIQGRSIDENEPLFPNPRKDEVEVAALENIDEK
jgi:hypothetical protein